ncbi:MAG: 4-hydroxy-tetrahydrodipicolinate synthase [Puniceicoccales bacterium]|jgi:4-hydroxy-tetrahydrodipicolinate synthase|nr:4-hydroxy-tetrahydrodipicolinate synthase [Puniceicoccales bacterium]
MNRPLANGIITALATPFRENEIDFQSLDRLLQWQLHNSVDALLISGTTGESPTLGEEEYEQLIDHTLQFIAGRIPVYVGTGSNCTKTCIRRTKLAKRLGADAALIVAPYYNRPTQHGLLAHFSAIADAVQMPIILYSIAARCAVEIAVETICELRETYGHICGLKDCECDWFSRLWQLRNFLGNSFCIYGGNDSATLPFLAAGGDGMISVASNCFPFAMKQLFAQIRQMNLPAAQEQWKQLSPWISLLSCETNPVPIKFLLHLQKLFDSPSVRLPLVELSAENRRRLECAYEEPLPQ